MKSHIFDTLFGMACILYRSHPFYLEAVILPCKNKALLEKKAGMRLPLSGTVDKAAADLGRILEKYYRGKPFDIPWDILDMDRFTKLQKAVYTNVAHIPWGETRSYGQVANEAGCPNAARFVGTTMANNPYPILIPCHRVVRSDGSTGQFGGGPELKKQMIALERK